MITREGFIELLNLIGQEKDPGGDIAFRHFKLRLSPPLREVVFGLFVSELSIVTHFTELAYTSTAYKIVGLLVVGTGWVDVIESEVGEPDFSIEFITNRKLPAHFCDKVKSRNA